MIAPRTALAALIVLASSCSGAPSAASKDGFATALRRALPDHPLCLRADGPLPRTVRVHELRVAGQWNRLGPDAGAAARLAAFDDAGLVRVMSENVTTPYPGKLQGTRTFGLTPTGSRAWRDSLPGTYGSRHGFCVGPKVLAEVTRFTEPAERRGRRVSQVEFTYRLASLPDWVGDTAVAALYPRETAEASRAARQPVPDAMKFVLTDEGWVPADDVPRP